MLDAGADIDRPNPDGMTPLIMALDNGFPEVALALLDRGANPHIWDWWGRTPLYVAVTMRGGLDGHAGPRSPASLAVIQTLLEAGVTPNPQLAFKEPSRGGRDNRRIFATTPKRFAHSTTKRGPFVNTWSRCERSGPASCPQRASTPSTCVARTGMILRASRRRSRSTPALMTWERSTTNSASRIASLRQP
jgi:hypothetical protein